MTERGFLSKGQVAEYLGISLSKLEGLMAEGLPHYKLGRRVLFRAWEINQWMEQFRLASAVEAKQLVEEVMERMKQVSDKEERE